MADTSGRRTPLRPLLVLVATVAAAASCGTVSADRPPASTPTTTVQAPTDPGLMATAAGFTLLADTATVPVGQTVSLRFHIVGPGGRTVTSFLPVDTKPMQLYLLRSDVTGFQHVFPSMAPDGTWQADLAPLQPGSYRAEVRFGATGADGAVVSPVLGVPFTVPGQAQLAELPPAAVTTDVDGYTVTVAGHLMPDMEHELAVTVTMAGQPVADLQPYLGGYAHLVAFQAKYLIFAELRPLDLPANPRGGPRLSFQVTMPEPGYWRFFLEFQTAGVVHTAAITRLVS